LFANKQGKSFLVGQAATLPVFFIDYISVSSVHSVAFSFTIYDLLFSIFSAKSAFISVHPVR